MSPLVFLFFLWLRTFFLFCFPFSFNLALCFFPFLLLFPPFHFLFFFFLALYFFPLLNFANTFSLFLLLIFLFFHFFYPPFVIVVISCPSPHAFLGNWKNLVTIEQWQCIKWWSKKFGCRSP
jgi:hypothetical protein